MANPVEVYHLSRPIVRASSGDGRMENSADADYLRVGLDRYGNGVNRTVIQLAFADYAGLETEWVAGTATTVLEAAISTYLGDSPVWPADITTPAQRAVTALVFTEV